MYVGHSVIQYLFLMASTLLGGLFQLVPGYEGPLAYNQNHFFLELQ